MVHFIGAGPGAPDLITVRGQKLLGEADIIIYAGSLVNPALLDLKKEGCVVYNSATMTLEQVIDVMKEAESKGQTVARLHTGDPCLYGAIREQIDALDALGVGVVGARVSLGHDRRHDREDQGDAVLAEQRERDCQSNCRVGVDLHADAEDCGHDAADDGVRWLGTSDGHVADGHELVRTADDETGLHVAEDETDDGTGDDGLVQ